MAESVRLTVLREILRYVQSFRDRTFVIALDSGLLCDPSLANLLVDIALLHSINIRPIVVADLAAELTRLQPEISPEVAAALAPVPPQTMTAVCRASGEVCETLLSGFCSVDLPTALAPAIVAHPAGIRGGIDWQYAGRIDRIDAPLLHRLIDARIVPILLPIGFDGEGHSYLVNADEAAAEVAAALAAAKLLYVTTAPGLQLQGQLVRQLRLEEATELLAADPPLPVALRQKLRCACRACRGGVERVHLVDGRVEEGLLAEVFSAEGVGTLIHRDEYAAIRPAGPKDAPEIFRLLQPAIANEELLPRTLDEIRSLTDRFLVYDLDGTIVGCVAVIPYAESQQAEIACLAVDDAYEHQGIGRRLVEVALRRARESGAQEAFVLTTQAANYFRTKFGFEDSTPENLPPDRHARWLASGRNSRVLRKRLD